MGMNQEVALLIGEKLRDLATDQGTVPYDTGELMRSHIVVAKHGSDVRKLVVSAVHNGTALADATSADFDVSSKLKIGSIAGFAVDVSLNGTTTAQVMRLQVTTTETTDVTVKAVRVPI